MKSLSDGPSQIVPIRMSESEKTDALESCVEGETLSSFVRDAVRERVKKLKWKQRKSKVRK
jgi:hypothetical protein